MSSSDSSASSLTGLERLSSPQPDHGRRVSTHGSDTRNRDGEELGRGTSGTSRDHTQPLGPPHSRSSRRSRVTDVDNPAWPEVLRHHPATHSIDENGARNHPTSHTNVDRKRRLTNPAHNSGRVRTISGGFHSRNQSSYSSQPDESSSTTLTQVPRYDPAPHSSSRASADEGSLRGLPPVKRHSSNMQHPVSTTREVILPKWQPDSEVSDCPICLRQFTFWFRKHHCRKCGRVVCANCSPHRITIPRQFIAHPPESTNRTFTVSAGNSVVVDLTGEVASSTRSDMPSSRPSPRRTSNPGLGGGEEVRLCNPCVPDPQPSPQATWDLAGFLRQGPGRHEIGRPLERQQLPRSLQLGPDQHSPQGLQSSSDEARELRRQRGRGMIVCSRGQPLSINH